MGAYLLLIDLGTLGTRLEKEGRNVNWEISFARTFSVASLSIRSQVIYALGALYYLCNSSTKKEILKPDVLRMIRDYSAAGAVNSSFSNLANAFLDKHVNS